jgi:hypothetical protein
VFRRLGGLHNTIGLSPTACAVGYRSFATPWLTRCFSFLLQQRNQIFLKFLIFISDCAAPAYQRLWFCIPPCVWSIEEICIPNNSGITVFWIFAFREPPSCQFLVIPKMLHSWIRYDSTRPSPCCSGIRRYHGKPDDINAQFRGRIFLKNIVLHPTGASQAGSSSW